MKDFLFALQVILGAIVVISILLQKSKADALSGLVQGNSNESFFSKNKGKTKEATLAKITTISMVLFALNTIALNLV